MTRFATSRGPPAVESTHYFVIAEGLANVARHAAANAGNGCVSLDQERVLTWLRAR